MNWLLRAFIQTLVGWWFKRQKDTMVHKAKVEGVRTYLKVLQGARLSALGMVGFLLVMQMMSFGLALMLGSGVFLSPWDLETKLWCILGLGGFLFVLPLIVMLVVFSERLWYRLSGADQMVAKILKYDSAS